MTCTTLTVTGQTGSKEWVLEFGDSIPAALQWLVDMIGELTGKSIYIEDNKKIVVRF